VRGDSGDAVGDAVALAQFVLAIVEQADERAVTLPNPRKQRLKVRVDIFLVS
jgi:hypothetical protein